MILWLDSVCDPDAGETKRQDALMVSLHEMVGPDDDWYTRYTASFGLFLFAGATIFMSTSLLISFSDFGFMTPLMTKIFNTNIKILFMALTIRSGIWLAREIYAEERTKDILQGTANSNINVEFQICYVLVS